MHLLQHTLFYQWRDLIPKNVLKVTLFLTHSNRNLLWWKSGIVVMHHYVTESGRPKKELFNFLFSALFLINPSVQFHSHSSLVIVGPLRLCNDILAAGTLNLACIILITPTTKTRDNWVRFSTLFKLCLLSKKTSYRRSIFQHQSWLHPYPIYLQTFLNYPHTTIGIRSQLLSHHPNLWDLFVNKCQLLSQMYYPCTTSILLSPPKCKYLDTINW